MNSLNKPIYQTQQIREAEQLAENRFAIAGQELMRRAGQAAFDFLLKRWPRAKKLAVLCGAGNNGGDGYVLAQYAHEHGLQVTIWQVGKQEHHQPEVIHALAACRAAGMKIDCYDPQTALVDIDLIVDAICGIGIKDILRAETLTVVEQLRTSTMPIFSLDIPTGIDADTGKILGSAVKATVTMTFIGLKLGLLTGSGIAHTGELVLNDLQLPSDLFAGLLPVAEQICFPSYATYLQPRLRDWHKGLSGHVLMIGGDKGFLGAPIMAATAALRVGAGLVSVATHPDHAALMTTIRPEVMCHGVAEPSELDPLIAKAKVVVIGPGLGQTTWGKTLWKRVRSIDLPLVVDADGLNFLSQDKTKNPNWILTPHPGEAARLLGKTTLAIQANRLSALRAIQAEYHGVCVLKGAGSLIQAPNGLPALCDKGNPGMASAGMGDVLSGVLGGLLAQGVPLPDAAKLGVYLHAMAGDLAAKKGERGMIATDLFPYLRDLSNPVAQK